MQTSKKIVEGAHIIEDILEEGLKAARNSLFDQAKDYYESCGYLFEREKDSELFKINNIPFKLSGDQSCFKFDTENMSTEMFEYFESFDEDFESDGFDTFEMVHSYLQQFPLYASKKLVNIRKTGVFENINNNMKRLIRYEDFKLNEGSYEDFMTRYGNEIRKAAQELVEICKFQMTASEETMDSIAPELDRILSKYDKNLDRFIFGHFEYASETIKEITDLAIRNMNSFGTEPQMVLFAIEEVHNFLTRKNLIIVHEHED